MVLPEGFSYATTNDVEELVTLVNSAYRGEEAKNGWTTEADLIEGIRIDTNSLLKLINKPGATFIKYETDGKIIGCVYLQKLENVLYLGMLTVDPNLQAKGIGKKLLRLSEAFATEEQLTHIIMNVISVRKELIAWYERQGYYQSDERKPVPADPRFGIPRRPLEFIIMKKDL